MCGQISLTWISKKIKFYLKGAVFGVKLIYVFFFLHYTTTLLESDPFFKNIQIRNNDYLKLTLKLLTQLYFD
jgi:hypothetical protein